VKNRDGGIVDLSTPLPPHVLRWSTRSWEPDLQQLMRDGSLVLKTPDRLVVDFVLRYQNGWRLDTTPGGSQHGHYSSDFDRRHFRGPVMMGSIELEPPEVDGGPNGPRRFDQFPPYRAYPLGSQVKMVLTDCEFEGSDGADMTEASAPSDALQWCFTPDANISVQWSTLEPDSRTTQHIFDFVRFDGRGFRKLNEVTDEAGVLLSYEGAVAQLRSVCERNRASDIDSITAKFTEQVYDQFKHSLLACFDGRLPPPGEDDVDLPAVEQPVS
jgi:hypothetical protein